MLSLSLCLEACFIGFRSKPIGANQPDEKYIYVNAFSFNCDFFKFYFKFELKEHDRWL